MEQNRNILLTQPKEVCECYLELAREDWLPKHRAAERAGHHNAELNLAEVAAMLLIDKLLDEYSTYLEPVPATAEQ